MNKQYNRRFRIMCKRIMELKLPINSRRSIIGQLRTLNEKEREALYSKVMQRYGGTQNDI